MDEAYGIRVNALCPNFADTPMVTGRPDMEAVVSLQPGGLLPPAAVAAALLRILDTKEWAGEAVVITAARGVRLHDFGPRAAPAGIPADALRELAKL